MTHKLEKTDQDLPWVKAEDLSMPASSVSTRTKIEVLPETSAALQIEEASFLQSDKVPLKLQSDQWAKWVPSPVSAA
jgi:hypothetical protein